MSGRTLVVTGVSRGIGLAIAKHLIEEGNRVIGLARTAGEVQLPKENYNPVNVDLADLKNLPKQLKSIAKAFPEISGVISNAGNGIFGMLEEISYEKIAQSMDLNFLSHACVARAFLPLMKRSGKGNLIFIGSKSGLRGSRKGSLYCAAKFALRGFSQALRDECAASGVHVSLINPGMVRTDFFNDLTFEPGASEENYLEAGDIAQTVSLILGSRQGSLYEEITLAPLTQLVNQKKHTGV
jgi:3-hydroxy acid dehydrogenase/malonic semialdehyde reductase